MISTGSRVIDEALGGGFPLGALILIYGEAGIGKTTLLMQTCLEYSLQGSSFLYVDCLGKIKPKRILSLLKRLKCNTLNNGFILPIYDFNELYNFVMLLEKFVSPKLRLIVFDTITRPYRARLGSRASNVRLNRLLNRILAFLFKLSRYYKITILLSSDIRFSIKEGRWEPIASSILCYWCDIILRLERANTSNVFLVIEKHPISSLVNRKVKCRLVETGIEGIEII